MSTQYSSDYKYNKEEIIMSQTVLLFKLTTNEEVIATVEQIDLDGYVLKRARVIAPMEAQNGQIGLVLIPWLMGSQDPKTQFESPIKLYKTAIVGEATEAPKALVDMYIQKTSGIQLVTG